jgi:hypothetical protein
MRAQLAGGGWRPSHFQVIISYPFAAQADNKSPFMCKAASIPAVTVGKIEVPYFGRKYPIPGDRVVEDWTCTVMNDNDFQVRDALERWSNTINSYQGNLALAGVDPNTYLAQAILVCFDRAGNVIRQYEMHGLFPMTVGSIETAWETTDTISEFQVTFAMSDFTLLDGVTGAAFGA